MTDRQRMRQVRSADELRPEMVVVVRDCRICYEDHVHALAARTPAGDWRTGGEFHRKGGSLVVGPAIREGRLLIVEPGTSLSDHMTADLISEAL